MPTIKRYSNRKLYNMQTRRYVNLEEIASMVQNGEEVQIVDHKSGTDLTASTLIQVILDLEKRIGAYIPNSILARMIQTSNVAFSHMRGAFQTALEPEEDALKNEINRRLTTLQDEGIISQEDYKKLKGHLTSPRFDQSIESPPLENQPDDFIPLEELHELINRVRDLESKLQAIHSNE